MRGVSCVRPTRALHVSRSWSGRAQPFGVAGDQVAVQVFLRMRGELAGPRLERRAELELVLGDPWLAERLAVHVLQREPRSDVGAVADADRGGLQRQLLHAHAHRRRVEGRGVGVDLDDGAFEEPHLLQPLLVVEQQLLVVRLAGVEGREAPHRALVVALQALDGHRAEAVQRAAVGDHVHLHLVALRIDARGGRDPVGRRIALGTQPRQREVLGLVPRRLAKRLARLQRPAPAQRGHLDDRVLVVGPCGLHQVAGEVDLPFLDDRPRTGHDGDVDPRPAFRALFAAHVHLGVEVTLGLQQRTGLRGRCGDEAVELDARDGVGIDRTLEAREVEVGLQQRAQLAGASTTSS
jgi:hypothetical protein